MPASSMSSLQRIDTRGSLVASKGFKAKFGDYEIRARYQRSEAFQRRTVPIHIMLVVDGSASMRGEPTIAVIEAIEEIMSWLNNFADSVSLFTFNDKILHKMKPTNISDVNMRRLRKDLLTHVQGLTRLNDALYTVCKSWNRSKFHTCAKFMVFLTDGGENDSKFSKVQVQRQLSGLSNVFDKFIFLTAGCDVHDISYLQSVLADVNRSKYAIQSARSNCRNDIKRLFGIAQEIIEEIVIEYYHKGKEIDRTRFVGIGGNKQRELARSGLADINSKLRHWNVMLEFY